MTPGFVCCRKGAVRANHDEVTREITTALWT